MPVNPTVGKEVFQSISTIDSLKQALLSAPEDSNKVKTLVNLGLKVSQKRDRPQDFKYMEEALSLSESIGFQKTD